ncbi:MAG: acyl-CoA dehydrogenase [Mycobacteriales bacterium]
MGRFLRSERETLERLLPGLDQKLGGIELAVLERPGSPGPEVFRAAGGPGLLVPGDHGGLGAGALAAVRVQRAVGARSPSLAVASTMHHFSVAGLVEASRHSTGFEWMMLEAIAERQLLVASGFAEGRCGQSVLSPTMRAERRGERIVVSGSKKPCSLSRSMDLLTASVAVPATGGGPAQLAVALIPRGTPGLRVEPFWGSPVLAGAESDEVILDEVELLPDLVVATRSTAERPLDDLQATGFGWFELLISASYLGVASALVERVLAAGRADAALRADVAGQVDAAMLAVEGVARTLDGGAPADEELLASALLVRFAAQDTIARVVPRCVESLGGLAYVGSDEVAYLAGAAAALGFHPPSRARSAAPLCDFYAGRPLRVA